MSKFLKFIVNLFLILSILVACAILIPPLVGIRTTIIDSPYIETNLPMGSVTYSKDIYVTEIAQGDSILKEDDTTSYVYVVETTDSSTGNFTVRNMQEAGAEPQTIQILNSVPKVVVTIPMIGYVVYAMHSIEGLIILSLIVLLMIILFILSELWRNDDDDEDEEEDEEDDADLSIPETEAYDLQRVVDIRPYMDKQMEITTGHTADMVSEPLPRITAPAAAAEAKAEPAGETGKVLPEEEAVTGELVSDEELAAVSETEEEKRAAEAEAEPVPVINVADPEPEETEAEEAEAAAEPEAESDAEAETESEPADEAETESEPAAEAEAAPEAERAEEPVQEAPAQEVSAEDVSGTEADTGFDMDRLEQGLEAALRAPAESDDAESAEEPASVIAADSPESAAGGQTGEITDTLAEIADAAGTTGSLNVAEAAEVTADLPKEEIFLEEAEEADPDTDTFIPVARPTLEELLKDVGEYGIEPEVKKDAVTGISIVDYSNII